MVVAVSYHVDAALYFSPVTEHTLRLSTTEYTYKNDMLVHIQAGKTVAVRLNHLLRHEFKSGHYFGDEQFLFKKTYNGGKAKLITRSAFDEKLRGFDMGQTVVEREIAEDYAYTDKKGNPDSVQIAVSGKGLEMTAAIDFKDVRQQKYFVLPAWLAPRL